MSYSQNGEDVIALFYFGEFKGNILSIGENDGKTLSNALLLIEQGWNAVLVEPSEKCFKQLKERHKGNDKVQCVKYAIAEEEGVFEFHESGSHLSINDHSLLSTLIESEKERWKGTAEFTKTKVKAITFDTLLEISDYKKFDLVSIDVEGLDWNILTQIDLEKIGCKMLIIETNSIEDKKYIDYCAKFGMKLRDKNHENLIFVK